MSSLKIASAVALLMATASVHGSEVKVLPDSPHCMPKPPVKSPPKSPPPPSHTKPVSPTPILTPITTTSNSRSTSAATSAASARSSQQQGQHQTQSQSQANDSNNVATGGDSAGGSSSIQSSSEYREIRQTPPAFAGTVQPTASCKNAINGGASAPIAGISFGFGKGDEECDRRELARSFYEMGDRDDALIILCQSKLAKKLPKCGASPEVTGFVTREELDQRDRELIRHGMGK